MPLLTLGSSCKPFLLFFYSFIAFILFYLIFCTSNLPSSLKAVVFFFLLLIIILPSTVDYFFVQLHSFCWVIRYLRVLASFPCEYYYRNILALGYVNSPRLRLGPLLLSCICFLLSKKQIMNVTTPRWIYQYCAFVISIPPFFSLS